MRPSLDIGRFACVPTGHARPTRDLTSMRSPNQVLPERLIVGSPIRGTDLRRYGARGFTLLEVLLALALLAIVGMSVLTMSGESVRNTPILEQRMLARLVADNQMTELYLQEQWPTLSWQWEEHDLAGQQWFTRSRSIKTADEDFRAIDVEVRTLRDAKSLTLATLRSYMVRQ